MGIISDYVDNAGKEIANVYRTQGLASGMGEAVNRGVAAGPALISAVVDQGAGVVGKVANAGAPIRQAGADFATAALGLDRIPAPAPTAAQTFSNVQGGVSSTSPIGPRNVPLTGVDNLQGPPAPAPGPIAAAAAQMQTAPDAYTNTRTNQLEVPKPAPGTYRAGDTGLQITYGADGSKLLSGRGPAPAADASPPSGKWSSPNSQGPENVRALTPAESAQAHAEWIARKNQEPFLAAALEMAEGRNPRGNVGAIQAATGMLSANAPNVSADAARTNAASHGVLFAAQADQARAGIPKLGAEARHLDAQAGTETAKAQMLFAQEALRQHELDLKKRIGATTDPKERTALQSQMYALFGKPQPKVQTESNESVDAMGTKVKTTYALGDDGQFRPITSLVPPPQPPPGMKQVGTSGGKPVYQDASGKRFQGS